MEFDSPACSSSLDRRSYKAVILISSFLATVLTSLLQGIFVCETLFFSILLYCNHSGQELRSWCSPASDSVCSKSVSYRHRNRRRQGCSDCGGFLPLSPIRTACVISLFSDGGFCRYFLSTALALPHFALPCSSRRR